MSPPPEDDDRDDQRERRATERAFAAGRREAEVDGRLNSHEERLRAINGSIEKHARNAADLGASINELKDKVDEVAGKLERNAAVEADRVKQLKIANESQISGRNFWLGIGAIVATLVAGQIAHIHLFGAVLG